MSTEHKNAVAEKDQCESDDDGFEVLDAEPEQEAEDFKHLSRNDFTNAGTIIFCHMEDEYNNIQEVHCHYIRPEGWNEKEKDEIAIFEVGWINIDDAVAKLPVDRNISKGYPLGSVDLTEFAFRKKEYVACPGEVSHFQFCYLRDGVLLGASTPFGIRGIKTDSRLSLMGGKPLFIPCGEMATDGGISINQSLPQINSMPADSLDLFQTSAVNIPLLIPIHDKLSAENEPVHDETNDFCEPESSLRNPTMLRRKLQNENCNKTKTCECMSKLILDLSQCFSELTAEIKKPRKVLPLNGTMTVTASYPEFWKDWEERFQACIARLEANVRDCSRTFDVCKNEMDNQTPPCSLSELEKSNYFRETEWKRQQVVEELQKRLKEAEEQIEKLKETEKRLFTTHEMLSWLEAEKLGVEKKYDDLLVDVADVKKQLTDKETELQQVKEELSVKDNDLLKSKNKLCSVEEQLRDVCEQLTKKESECQQMRESGMKLQGKNYTLNGTIEELKVKLKNVQKNRIDTECRMKSQLEVVTMRLEELKAELLLKETNHRYYVVQVSSERMEMENKLKAVSDECGGLRSQITTLQEEAKLYKSKLGETIVELANSRRETDDLKDQHKKLVEYSDFLENDKTRLQGNIDTLKEKLEKSEELLVARQQVENFQDELSRLSVQRTNLQKELLEARQNPTSCEKPCCTFEVDPGRKHTDSVVQSILEALEQSLQENKRLQSDLETEKKRSQSLDEKLQSAAGIQRGLYMEKITLESRLNELLGTD